MNGQKVEFPGELVGYRIDAVHDGIVLFEEVPVLLTDGELERRLETVRALEKAGGMPYTFELVSLEELDATTATIRADLERQLQQVKDWWRGREKREPEPVRNGSAPA
jgi:hypothetical protein